jgi:hypothetical protein
MKQFFLPALLLVLAIAFSFIAAGCLQYNWFGRGTAVNFVLYMWSYIFSFAFSLTFCGFLFARVFKDK